MKRIILACMACLALLVATPAFAQSALTQTFDDEFTSFSASASGAGTTWKTQYIHDNRTLSGNKEVEYYSDPSVGVNPFSLGPNGLTITAAPGSNPAGLPYNSGVITTEKSFSQLYGYFEMRAKMPAGAGMWPAFWLLPASGAWPPELDATEVLGGTSHISHMTVHSNATGTHTSVSIASGALPDLIADFHTYGVYWGANKVVWYFDGKRLASTPTPADMHTPMYLLADFAVGGVGSWPGPAVAGSSGQMQIQFIHAYADDGKPGVLWPAGAN